MSTIDVKKGDLFQHPTKGLIRFDRWENHNVMMFKPSGAKEFPLLEHKFVEMHGRGEIRLVQQDADGNPIQLREFGPGEGWTDPDDTEEKQEAKSTAEGRRALAFQFYTKKWDEEGGGPLGDIGLQNLISRWRPICFQLGFETNDIPPGKKKKPFRVQVARLRHYAKHCGRPGERPLEAFRKMTGQSSKRRCADEVEIAIKKAVEYFYSARPITSKNAFGFLVDEIKKLNRGLPEEKRFKLPKAAVLSRRIDKAMTYDNLARKTTPREAWRKIHGFRRHISAKRPLELGIMDSTMLDVFVLDSTTLMPLGRPQFNVCLDVATRMPLGYCITFEPPSLYSALLTLKRVNKNKNYVQRLYPWIKRPWDGSGCLTELILDRDWAHQARSFQHAMSNLGTDIHWAPANTPQYKAIGERLFRTINEGVIHKLAGAVRYNSYIMRQVGLDPSKDALVTLDDLDELIHEFIEVYIYDRHDGIGAVPARVWQEGLAIQRRRFIGDVKALDHILGRVDTATISGAGIKFKNMRWHDENVTSLLLNDLVRYEKKRSQDPRTFGQSRAKVIVKWNPADASSISVWNRGGEPKPYWVTMPNADPEFLKGLSFWHHDRLREFAEAKDLEFSTEEQRWDAYNRLRRHWEKLAGEMPMRNSRQARRGLAWHLGQFDDTTTNELPEITIDDIKDVEVEASTAGLNRVEPEGVPDQLAAELLDRDQQPPKGRTPSRATVAKVQRTKKRKKAEAEQAEHEAYVKDRRGDPTGDPHARGTPVVVEDGDDVGWGETDEAPATAPTEQPEDETADDEGW